MTPTASPTTTLTATIDRARRARGLQPLAVTQLAGLRARRARRGEEPHHLAALLRPMAKALRARARRLGGIVERWEQAAPDQIRAGVQLGKFASGVLTLHCPSPAARARLDRWLRSGGAEALRTAGINQVKTTTRRRSPK